MIQDISGDDPEKRNEHLNVILKETEYLNNVIGKDKLSKYTRIECLISTYFPFPCI